MFEIGHLIVAFVLGICASFLISIFVLSIGDIKNKLRRVKYLEQRIKELENK